MRKGVIAGVITSALVGNPISFHLDQYSDFSRSTSISGKIFPAEAAEIALIINAKDTFKTSIKDGSFSLPVLPGGYSLTVIAKPPYKNVSLGTIEVKKSQDLNVGELILQK